MIRRATPDDAQAIGEIFIRARDLMPYLPRIPSEDRSQLGGWIVERHETWVAEEDGRLYGFVGLTGELLDHIYVDPEAQNGGVGTALFDHVKALRPAGVRLWVFQKNEGARRFYERHGCRLVDLTNGAANMEREPDALYEWTPTARESSAR